MRGSRHRGFAQALAALALLAMAARALVPAGYMFAPARGGDFISVALCSGHGAVEALIDLSTGAVVDGRAVPDDQPASNAGAPCVFASAAPLAAPETPAMRAIALRTLDAEPIASVPAAPGRGLAAPPPWPTGPPSTL
jgi:hypothetical protein